MDLRTDVAHPARVYDFILGGTSNYPADREAAAQAVAGWPNLPTSMRQNRLFVQRTARYLAQAEGVRQFLDIGSGIPTSPNLHEVTGPDSSVVYVDNDPVVLREGTALLTPGHAERVRYVEADMRSPESILEAPAFTELIDPTRPVALSIVAVLQFVPDDVAHDVVRRLLEPLAAGSFLVLSMVTADHDPGILRTVDAYNARGMFAVARSAAQVREFFTGMQMIEPGVSLVHRWRPELGRLDDERATDADVAMSGGVARK
ncbi:SAM-dependent methyltransferase [Kineosporia sp. J2-2]|uniref:SAM-dependent methyltransferase n=1 Tax=Kineosporia corallincola TaxID=2835133 RepID=A0ABS5TEA3_9ACTN|nr:SAM-dependent methyltransferase [Kineosporia corallincola]MBT0769417.1 SAM-dependent methyltransferase [Kineosporia corallincola]